MKLFTFKKAFYALWAGQSVSILGSGMTRFALMIWAFQNTSSITGMVLLSFFSALAFILVSPFAGVVTDRVSRKWLMFCFDLASGFITLGLLWLSLNGEMQMWHLYLAEGLSGAFEAFQSPAFFSSVSLLMPKEEYTRSNAMIGLARSASKILAPAFGSALLAFGGLDLVLKIDLISMLPGLLSVLLVMIPKAEHSEEGMLARGDFWHEFRFGFRYIFTQPGLREILLIFVGINLFAGFTYMSILSPMILTRSGGDQFALGTVQTVMGVGGILGSLALTFWRSPKKKAALFTWATFISFGTCDFLTAISRTTFSWSIAGFLSEIGIPFMVNPYYSIWQERVPTDVQGRVFAVREMIQTFPSPIGYLLGGLAADHLFEPFFSQPNFLSGLVGFGPGAGMSAMFLITGLMGALTGLFGVLHPAIRKLDEVYE